MHFLDILKWTFVTCGSGPSSRQASSSTFKGKHGSVFTLSIILAQHRHAVVSSSNTGFNASLTGGLLCGGQSSFTTSVSDPSGFTTSLSIAGGAATLTFTLSSDSRTITVVNSMGGSCGALLTKSSTSAANIKYLFGFGSQDGYIMSLMLVSYMAGFYWLHAGRA